MLHKVDCNVICFEVLIIVWNAGAKDGKDQVKRTAVIIRRAVAWALDIRDPDDFDTRGYILFPQANLKPCVDVNLMGSVTDKITLTRALQDGTSQRASLKLHSLSSFLIKSSSEPQTCIH